MKRGMYDWIYR